MKKEKILIGVILGIIFTAAPLLILSMRKNDAPTAEITMEMVGEDGTYHAVDNSVAQSDSGILLRFEDEKEISDSLTQLNWVNTALISISSDNSSVTAVLDINRKPYQYEVNDVIEMIALRLDGLKKENIFITDENRNIIYPPLE